MGAPGSARRVTPSDVPPTADAAPITAAPVIAASDATSPGDDRRSPADRESRITVLVVDDHPVVRNGLRGMFESAMGFAVLGGGSERH